MALRRPYFIPKASQAIGVAYDARGREMLVFPTKPWYRLFFLIMRLVGTGSPLEEVEDSTLELADDVAQNANDIADAVDEIDTTNNNVQQNAEDIQSLADELSILASGVADLAQIVVDISDILNNHISQTEAHGSNGDIIGKDDLATLTDAGLVLKGADTPDSTATTVNQITADHNILLQNLRNAGVI